MSPIPQRIAGVVNVVNNSAAIRFGGHSEFQSLGRHAFLNDNNFLRCRRIKGGFKTFCRLSLRESSARFSDFRGAKGDNQIRKIELDSFAGSYCHHYPICVRRVLADDTLISMSSPTKADSSEDWYAISLISYNRPSQRKGFFDFANYLAPAMAARFGARAHWGKYNPLTADENLRLYHNLNEFKSIRKKFDPDGRFENDWLSKVM